MSESRVSLPRSHDGGIYGLVVHDGRLISGGGEGTIVVQSADGASMGQPVEMPGRAGVLDLALAPDGSAILVGHMKGALRMDPITRSCDPLAGPSGWVRSVAWDSLACAAVGDDKQLWYWTPDSSPVAVAGLGGILHHVALCRVDGPRPDATHLAATIDSWRTLDMRSIEQGPAGPVIRPVWQRELPDDDIPILAAHEDAIAVAGDQGPIRILDALTGDTRQELDSPWGVTAMYWDRDGLVTGHRDLQLRLWSLATGTCQRTWASGHANGVNAIARADAGYVTGDDAGVVIRDRT